MPALTTQTFIYPLTHKEVYNECQSLSLKDGIKGIKYFYKFFITHF